MCLFVLLTRPACFSPVPAVTALGVPPAEGGIAEPKSRGDEPASHSSGSPRNHRRIHLHYPPPAPPYPALLRAGSRRWRCQQRVLRARPGAGQCLASSAPCTALLGHGARDSSLSYNLVPGLSHYSPFLRGPKHCLRVCSPALGRTLRICRGSLLCVPLVRNLSSFHSLTVCS